jgi:hypothetical protein
MADPMNPATGWGELVAELLYLAEDVFEPFSPKGAQMLRDAARQLEADLRDRMAAGEPPEPLSPGRERRPRLVPKD